MIRPRKKMTDGMTTVLRPLVEGDMVEVYNDYEVAAVYTPIEWKAINARRKTTMRIIDALFYLFTILAVYSFVICVLITVITPTHNI